jgi:hypothetical protein
MQHCKLSKGRFLEFKIWLFFALIFQFWTFIPCQNWKNQGEKWPNFSYLKSTLRNMWDNLHRKTLISKIQTNGKLKNSRAKISENWSGIGPKVSQKSGNITSNHKFFYNMSHRVTRTLWWEKRRITSFFLKVLWKKRTSQKIWRNR